MKKRRILILMLWLFLLVGCSNKENNSENINKNNNLNNNESNLVEENISLKDPIMEWCELYNPNGIDTITCVISNPNNVDIDFTYDLVFYKDGKEVSKQEDWAKYQISSKHKDIIWENVDIPKSIDVDEVKMENITVSKSYYESIDAEIKYVETIDDEAYFSVKHTKKPTLSNIIFLLYNDKNKNKKCDKGELVVTSNASTMEEEDKVYFITEGYNYSDYEVYYNAY